MKKKRTSIVISRKKSQIPAGVKQAAQLAAQVQLADFRLIGAKCAQDFNRIVTSKDLPTHVNQTVQFAAPAAKNSKSLKCVVRFTIEARYEPDLKSKPAIALDAQFGVTYLKRLGAFSNKDIESIAEIAAALNVWPYWREFVQSTTARMGLPPLQIPLLNVGDLINASSSSAD